MVCPGTPFIGVTCRQRGEGASRRSPIVSALVVTFNRRVQHLRANPGPPDIEKETDPGRVPLPFYHYRTVLDIRRRHYGWLWFAAQWVVVLRAGFRSLTLRPFSVRRASAVWGGLIAGLFFRSGKEWDELVDLVRPREAAIERLSFIAAATAEPMEALLDLGRRSPPARP